MEYIKLFGTHAEYETYSGGDMLRPNVSYCIDNNEVHYNPILPVETRVICTFTVNDASNPTKLYDVENISAQYSFTKIEVDGNEINLISLDYNEGAYNLSQGEHTVCYTLAFNTEIEQYTFKGCTSITQVTLPNTVTTIGEGSFTSCKLTSVTFGNSITSIGDRAFAGGNLFTSITIPRSITSIGSNAFFSASNLLSVTVEATTPPTLGNYAFNNNASGRKIYVPADSVAAYKAASGWLDYANDIEAIPTT